MSITLRRALLAVAATLASGFFVAPVPALAAELEGTVSTGDGRPASAATVQAIHATTQSVHDAVADAQGRYRISGLVGGPYRVEARVGDSFAVVTDVSLGAGERATLNLRLRAVLLVDRVAVTASSLSELESVPGGVAEIGADAIRGSRAGNLKDVMAFTPGLLVQPRFGAEESQLSVRGSGLRNNFHHRSLNLFVNGIPYQDADGFSDFESIELMSTQRIELWKGANALEYGANSSGGALNFVTYQGTTAPSLQVGALGGSFGFHKEELASGGIAGPIAYYGTATHLGLDGFREHSRQRRDRGFGNLGWTIDPRTELRLDFLYAHVEEKLPGALLRSEFEADPRQADANNVANDWGREYDYGRVGAQLTRALSPEHELSLGGFAHYRDMEHPIFQILVQKARNAGGVVSYRGRATLAGRPLRIGAGFQSQFGNIDEERFANQGGQRGALAASYGADSKCLGVHLRGDLELTSVLDLAAGLRADRATRPYEDRFPSDGDRSDRRTYEALVPKLGLSWRPGHQTTVFANASRSFEPPLTLELTGFGSPGLLDLDAQDSWQFELGGRGRHGAQGDWEVAIYDTEIRDEILNVNVQPFPGAPFTVPSYRNAERTRHQGVELGGSAGIELDALASGDRLTSRLAYTLSEFRFVDDPSFANGRLPGAPRHMVRGEVRYQHPAGIWVAPNVDWSPADYPANSENTVENEAYAALNLRAGYERRGLMAYVEVSNLSDELYSPSVQVDNAVGRFFEPAPGRAVHVGLRWWRSRP